jgi:hypothetical protein
VIQLTPWNRNIHEKLIVAQLNRTIGVLGFDSRRGLGIFLFTTASTTVLGPTYPMGTRGSFPGGKAAGT